MDYDQRLRHLIGILYTVQNNSDLLQAFDMNFFCAKNEQFECGFAGCAIGHAASDPDFNEMGLVIQKRENRDWNVALLNPKTKELLTLCADEAAKKFFDITRDEYFFLFEPGSYTFHSRGDSCLKDGQPVPYELYQEESVYRNALFSAHYEEDLISPNEVIARIEYVLKVGRGQIENHYLRASR